MKPCIFCGELHSPLHTIKIQTIVGHLQKKNDAEGNVCAFCWGKLMNYVAGGKEKLV